MSVYEEYKVLYESNEIVLLSQLQVQKFNV